MLKRFKKAISAHLQDQAKRREEEDEERLHELLTAQRRLMIEGFTYAQATARLKASGYSVALIEKMDRFFGVDQNGQR